MFSDKFLLHMEINLDEKQNYILLLKGPRGLSGIYYEQITSEELLKTIDIIKERFPIFNEIGSLPEWSTTKIFFDEVRKEHKSGSILSYNCIREMLKKVKGNDNDNDN